MLVDARTAAAVGSISITLWHDLVRDRKAPAPAIKQVRFTRWRLADVRNYWADRANRGSSVEDAQRIASMAVKASKAAKAKRTEQEAS